MRMSATVKVTGVDASIATVVALLVRRWLELEFDDDGVVLVDGRRREGLALVAGEHGRAGARYEVVTAGEHPRTCTVELPVDAAGEFRVQVRENDTVPVDYTVTKSAIGVAFDGDTQPPLQGVLQGRVSIDLDRLPGPDPDAPQVLVGIAHTRAAVSGEVWITPNRDGSWEVLAKADARGRGILRPLVSPVLWFVGRRELPKWLNERAAEIDKLANEFGRPLDPAKVADRLAADFLAAVVPYKIRT